MNRRDSLKALAIGSITAGIPVPTWATPGGKNLSMKSKTATLDPDPAIADVQLVLHLVADKEFIDAFFHSLPGQINVIQKSSLNEEALIKRLAAGEGMIWIGNPEGIPKELSVGGFRPGTTSVTIDGIVASPIQTNDLKFKKSIVSSAFISPPKGMPYHNIDEEVRADFLPILESKDDFGQINGYPAALMTYYASSLAGKRFKGSECFFFLFDNPLDALSKQEWGILLDRLAKRKESGLQVCGFETNYASYKPGERVQVRSRIQSQRTKAVSLMFRYSLKVPGLDVFKPLTTMRRVPEGGSETEAICDFKPVGSPGLYTLRMEVLQDPERAEILSVEGEPVIIDQRDLGFMVVPEEIATPEIYDVKGPSILIEGEEGFWAGTHYYPSSSWWEWVWRDFRPLKAAADFAAIRKAGYRIVRVWIDPIMDEVVLRAMDAAVYLAAQNGIVLDVCFFTQWVKKIGFERDSGELVEFEYRGIRDFNIISFSLRNLNLQREYVQVLGRRWKNAGNIIYNLANEVYIKDPDVSQLDKEVLNWEEIPAENGTVRDTLLFRRWAKEMTEALVASGAQQVVIPGYMFSTMNGGDFYLGNEDAPLAPWHCYLPPEQTGLTLQYFDPICKKKPILLEEFGYGQWNPVAAYDGNVHYALGAGAAGAMSYEWGLSWLARESCYGALPLREASVSDPDPRWFPPYPGLGKEWSERGVGLCPTPSGAGYGSIYHGTPFPAEAAVALSRLGLMGQGLQRVEQAEEVYVVIPASQLQALKTVQDTLKELWGAKAIFGVWQENSLADLPTSVKAIICPFPLSVGSRSIIEHLKSSGVQVYEGAEGWRSCKQLEKVLVHNAEKTELLSRRTLKGTLFTIISKELVSAFSLKHRGVSIMMDIGDFGLIHLTDKGPLLLEGTGNLQINGQPFCMVDKGRLIVASNDGKDLLNTKQLKLMVNLPTRLTFKRKIAALAIGDGFNKPLEIKKYKGIQGNTLVVDDQLSKYVIHIFFR